MALTINTTITTPEGLEITNAYGRVSVADNKFGATLQCLLDIYASETSFTNGKEAFNMPALAFVEINYDRTVNGVDILDLAHDALIAKLAAVGISATKVL